jgi:hypothetical protein
MGTLDGEKIDGVGEKKTWKVDGIHDALMRR